MLDLTYQKPNYIPTNPANYVYVCRGVPFDREYHHTILYASASAQFTAITAKAKYQKEALTPISLQTAIRLPYVADDLYDCNYLVFCNTNFSTKVFYAFIDNVTYVNPGMCQVAFTLDIMQTFLFDMVIGQCMVEREHVNDDTIGKHIIDEGLHLTQYTNSDEKRANVNSEAGIRILYTNLDGHYQEAVYDRIYQGMWEQFFPIEQASSVTTIINAHSNSPDDIVSIQMIPYKFYNENGNSKSIQFTYEIEMEELDGYVPKNNKLFTYPYNFLYVDNSQGQGQKFQFENWEGVPKFNLECSVRSGTALTVLCIPAGKYEGWTLGENLSQTLTLSGYPMCAWVSDTYKAFAAQENSRYYSQLTNQTLNAVTSMALSGATGNTMDVAKSAVRGASNIIQDYNTYLTTMQNAQLLPDKTHGNQGTSTLWSNNAMDFYFTRRCVKYDIAKTIDDYFTRYGYRVDKVKVPNLTGRTSYNYVKTKGAVITGNLPWDVQSQISSIFDRGITFWHGDYIGDFNRNNTIVTTSKGGAADGTQTA